MSASSNIRCSLCLNPLQDPYILPCTHNLCRACIDRAVELQNAIDVIKGVPEKKPKTDSDKDKPAAAAERVFVCPSCGKKCTADKCVPNEEMRQVVALEMDMLNKRASSGKLSSSGSASRKSDVCGFCEKPATIYCCFCGPLCQEHSDFLHVTGPMKMHELSSRPRSVLEVAFNTPASTAKLREGDKYDTMPLCGDHEQPLYLFCSKCNVLVCSSCAAFGAHKGHKVVDYFEVFTDQREILKKMVGSVEEKFKACESAVGAYERMAKGSDSERFSLGLVIRKEFKALRSSIDEQEKQAHEAIDKMFTEYQTSVAARLKAVQFLRAEAERLIAVSKGKLEAAEETRGRFDMSLYSLYQAMTKIQDAINYLSSMKFSPDSEICRVSFSTTPEKLFKSYFTCSCPLLGGNGKSVAIDFSKLRTVRNIDAFPANHGSTHDGGAIIDPVRRLVVAFCGSFNSGRTLLVTHLPDVGFDGATTETRERIVPFGVHGQYPVFDGEKYVYFFQSEDGSNDSCARMDLDTFEFHRFNRHPDRFLEYASGCVVGKRVYIMDSDRNLTYLDTEADSWTNTELHLNGRCRLLANPFDDKHIYAVCTDDHIYTIDIEANTSSTLCDIPGSYSLDANNEALLVPTSPESFAIFTYFRDHFQAYDSATNTWTTLQDVRYSRGGGGHLVCDTKSSYLYYHSGSKDTWDAIPLF